MMEIRLSSGKALLCQDTPLHTGAEGDVYLSNDQSSIIKLYHSAESNRKQSLDAIIGQYNAVREEPFWRDYFCWPDSVVVSPRLGVTMPRASDGLKSLDWFILLKARSRLPNDQLGTWSGHVSITLRLSRAMRRLHQLGLCHSDLSRKNCLVNPVNGRISLIDLDGLVVPGLLPPRVSGTPEFMAPEIIASGAKPSIYTDLHSLAVLIYQTLLFRHPLKGPKIYSTNPEEDDRLAFGEKALYIENQQDTSNRPHGPFPNSSILGPSLQHLFEEAFVQGLHNQVSRPQAATWEAALIRLVDRTITCSNPTCRGRHFPYIEGKKPVCPWCKTPWVDKPSLALLDLYRPVSGRKGLYIKDDFTVVGNSGRMLYEWHVYPERPPGPRTNKEPFLEIKFDTKDLHWLVTNLSSEKMKVCEEKGNCQDLGKGDTKVLMNGMRIILNESPLTRIANVRIISIR